jgi:hypothetical protein
MQVITPIIHMNGDRREVLLSRLEQAYEAVWLAMDALRQCGPNGSNFSPEPGRIQLAEAKHRERQERLQAVWLSLVVEAVEIDQERRNP